jgi:thiopurine S-methyltransferase
MEPTFWHDRWQRGDIGFHQAEVHDLLPKHWPSLGLAAGSQVFVPLCGKSLDMVWLANRGHRIVGAELSEIAVDAFFAERGLAPDARAADGFIVKAAGPYELWCGDIFDLPPRAAVNAGAAYDRASLVAFPAAEQARYADRLAELVPASAPVFLVSLDFDEAEMTGPPFSTPPARVKALFGDRYEITRLEQRQALDRNPALARRGLTALEECLYLLRRR